MSKIFIEDTEIQDIADAIREKNGTNNTYKPSEMPQGVESVYNAGYEQGKAEGGEFIGVKYSDFKNDGYRLPRTADARGLEKAITRDVNGFGNHSFIMGSLFNNDTQSGNAGFNAVLETAYLPNGATGLPSTFVNCTKLKTIVNTSSITSLHNAFNGCTGLTEVPYFPNMVKLGVNAFNGCTGLTSITFYKVLTTWHTGALTGCTNIETINLVDGWNTRIYAQHCPKLTSECVENMISCLADMTGQTAPTIQFHADVKAKLTDEQIATITNKNWTLA